MKSIKSLMVVILVLVANMCFAAAPGCDRYINARDVSDCDRTLARAELQNLMQAKAALTQDYKNLGITDAEKAAVRSYVQAALKDSDNRCGVAQWDCYYEEFALINQELKAFEDKKLKEKQARNPVGARPSLSSAQKTKALTQAEMELARRNEEEVGD